jgi:hypothetical protein
MNYKIVMKRYIEDLEREVNRLIKNGWIPLGGVAISVTPPTKWSEELIKVTQTMVKKEIQ